MLIVAQLSRERSRHPRRGQLTPEVSSGVAYGLAHPSGVMYCRQLMGMRRIGTVSGVQAEKDAKTSQTTSWVQGRSRTLNYAPTEITSEGSGRLRRPGRRGELLRAKARTSCGGARGPWDSKGRRGYGKQDSAGRVRFGCYLWIDETSRSKNCQCGVRTGYKW